MLVLDRVGKTYPNGVNALERFSIEIRLGEIVAVIGGSGCGKSTLLRAIAGLDRASYGTIMLDGEALTAPHPKVGIIFQEPRLLPWLSVADNIGFGLSDVSAPERRDRVAAALAKVGLSDKAKAWPRELSGGQAQRVAIARALTLDPALIICDEAVSSLDVLIQAQVLNLFEQLRDELGLSYLFIAHDLALVKQVSDRVAVMYLGKLAEIGPAEALYREPLHPYTVALLASIPSPDPTAPKAEADKAISGDPPSPIDPPSGCRFRTRCPRAQERCAVEEPELRELRTEHAVACHFPVTS
jgi:oligopeptide/dipeptide ABC transporter ATP-binding protein